ncbi:MAG: hypothetical protein WC023_02665 [Rhodocyclaceae bacterium]
MFDQDLPVHREVGRKWKEGRVIAIIRMRTGDGYDSSLSPLRRITMPSLRIVFVSLSLSFGLLANAQTHDPAMHRKHMANMPVDGRQLVNFPPPMRDHTLANMRDHLQALSEIIGALSVGNYVQAANIANARLGMESPSADGCASDNSAAPKMSKPASIEQLMNERMPEGMRRIGLEMHKSASAFAVEANKAANSGNAQPALAALSRVTQQCASCHAAYKVQ